MAYCVNCGVKLEETLTKCPLCNTPVYHPQEEKTEKKVPPYPSERGTVEKVKRTDLAILLIVLFGSTAVGCGLLNLFVYKGSLWSLYVIGACLVFLVFSIPIMVYRKLPYILMVLIDGCAVLFLSGACGMGESRDGLVCADCSPHYSARNGSCGSPAICLSACQQIYFIYGDGCCDRDGSVLCGH